MTARPTASGRRRRGSPTFGGALTLGLGAAGAALWAIQHRSVGRAVASAGDVGSEGLVLPEGLTSRDVEVDDGARIHVIQDGRGPTLVLVHGFMLDSSIWARQFRDLRGSHRVVALDLRGHGRSEIGTGFGAPSDHDSSSTEILAKAATMAQRGVGAPGIRRMALDLRSVVEELDLHEVLLVGHSMGGMVALQLAQDHPDFADERITGMVLTSTLAGPFVRLRGFGHLTRVVVPASARAVLLAGQLGVRAVPSQDLRYWLSRMGFGADATAAQVCFVEALHLATPSSSVAGLLPCLAAFDLSAGLGSIDIPVLVTVGSHDHLTPPRQARRMASALPRAELVEFARCGHMPMIERPHEFSHLLEEFSAKTRRM